MIARPKPKHVREELAHVAHICHRLSVATASHHQEPTGSDLPEQQVYVTAATLAEYRGRTDDHKRSPIGRLGLPLVMYSLRPELGTTVRGIGRRHPFFRNVRGDAAINGNRTRENELSYTMIATSIAEVHSAVDIHFLIETGGADVVTMNGGKIIYYLDPLKRVHEGVASSYVCASKCRVVLPRSDKIDYRYHVS